MSKLYFNIILILVGLVIYSCNDDDKGPSKGILNGTVSDGADGSGLNEATIIVFNASNNSPISTVTSNEDGYYEVSLDSGSYFTKVTKQGYLSNPASGFSPVPFSIDVGETIEKDVTLFILEDNNLGLISGSVTSDGIGVVGVLVVASDGEEAYSAITDADGEYKIYNAGRGSYVVQGFIAGYSSQSVATSVSLDAETTDVDIEITPGATGSLTGSITNLAAVNKDVDVSLVHYITKETIPGLSTFSFDNSYSISNIPTGTYLARASYTNDERVMDPDYIFKFGEPQVSIIDGEKTLDFSITNSVTLVSPTNSSTDINPVELSESTPTFEWESYSSTSDYVIEVTDATTGSVVWGGIDQSGALPVKNIVIPSNQTTIDFNEDGNASTTALEVGKVYRWRIFASKDDVNSDTGWTLISGSEDQMGLIKIIEE